MLTVPSPKSPALLQLVQWITDPIAYYENCAKVCGDIFTIPFNPANISFSPVVFISNPQAIQEIFSANPKLFSTGQQQKPVATLIGKNSLFVSSDDRHDYYRRLLIPHFHGQRVQVYGNLICQIASAVSDQWTVNKPFSVMRAMQEITLQVIMQIVFGLYTGSRYNRLRRLLADWTNSISSPLNASLLFFKFLRKDLGAWSPWGKFLRLRREIDELLYTEIQERRAQLNPDYKDILSLMMSAYDEQGEGMTDEELHDQLLSLLFAGHETTATSLAWAFYWIHSLPSVRSAILQELDLLGNSPELTAIFQLPYLTAICQETLRIYPPTSLFFNRILKVPMQLNGYQFEPGTALIPNIYLTHHREDLYTEPKQFKPDRFLERQYSPSEYLPFGGTNRYCMGASLAMLELKLVLATILSRYNLKLANQKPVRQARRGLMAAPSDNLKLIVTSQRQQNC